MYGYPAVLERDDDGRVLVTFPDFPEVHTFGEDIDEAVVRARDALATIVDAYITDRQAIPDPSIHKPGTYAIRLPALTKAKVDLYMAMRQSGITKTDLARRLGWHLPQVDRLLNVHHASRLDQIERALGAVGKELFVAALDSQTPRQLRIGALRSGAIGGYKLPDRTIPPDRATAKRRGGRKQRRRRTAAKRR